MMGWDGDEGTREGRGESSGARPFLALSFFNLSTPSLSPSTRTRTHLESVDERLAGLHVLAVVVVDHVKGAGRDGRLVGRAAPGDLDAVGLQGRVLGEGGFSALLGLWMRRGERARRRVE